MLATALERIELMYSDGGRHSFRTNLSKLRSGRCTPLLCRWHPDKIFKPFPDGKIYGSSSKVPLSSRITNGRSHIVVILARTIVHRISKTSNLFSCPLLFYCNLNPSVFLFAVWSLVRLNFPFDLSRRKFLLIPLC